MVSGYVKPMSEQVALVTRKGFGGKAAKWNRTDCNSRYEFLVKLYGVTGDTISKFSLQRWNQLPVGMRYFIGANS